MSYNSYDRSELGGSRATVDLMGLRFHYYYCLPFGLHYQDLYQDPYLTVVTVCPCPA